MKIQQLARLCIIFISGFLLYSVSPGTAPADEPVTAPLLRTDHSKVLEEIFRKAELGDAEAQYALGLMHYSGENLTPDYKKALTWFSRAAEQGHANAQFVLGVIYYYGKEGIRDYAQALKWFSRAAEQGNVLAQYNLGVMYHQGHGVPVDYAQAYVWYDRAAAQGDDDAKRGRNLMKEKMNSEEFALMLRHKTDSVDVHGGRDELTGTDEFSAPHAKLLQSVSVRRLKAGAEIYIHADGPIREYTTFTLPNPDRIVYDFKGLKSPYREEQTIAVDASPCLSSVRHYGNRQKVRVVLDSDAACFDAVSALTVHDGLLLHINYMP